MRVLLVVAAILMVASYQAWFVHPYEDAELAHADASEASLILPIASASECSVPLKIEDRDRTGAYATD